MYYYDFYWMFFEGLLRNKLEQGVVSVKFLKKDGSIRVMNCTLSPSLLTKVAPSKKASKDSDDPYQHVTKNIMNMPVYDVEAEDWRSFNLNDVLEVDQQTATMWSSAEIHSAFHRRPSYLAEKVNAS